MATKKTTKRERKPAKFLDFDVLVADAVNGYLDNAYVTDIVNDILESPKLQKYLETKVKAGIKSRIRY